MARLSEGCQQSLIILMPHCSRYDKSRPRRSWLGSCVVTGEQLQEERLGVRPKLTRGSEDAFDLGERSQLERVVLFRAKLSKR